MTSSAARHVAAVARREIRTATRNRGTLVLFVGLAAILLGLTWLGDGHESGFAPTVVDLLTPVELLVPVLAFAFGYRALLGDRESGELETIRTYPIASGGYVFGVWYGTLYSMIGTVIGTTIVFVLARRYGRPYVERFVAPEWIDKFDVSAGRSGKLFFFGFFLVPGLPDDVVCFVAGLTKISLPTLFVIATVGRFPSILLFNLAGAQVADDQLAEAAALLGAIVVISVVVLYYLDRILAYMRRRAA